MSKIVRAETELAHDFLAEALGRFVVLAVNEEVNDPSAAYQSDEVMADLALTRTHHLLVNAVNKALARPEVRTSALLATQLLRGVVARDLQS